MSNDMDLLDQKLAEKEALEKEIAQLMARERKDAIARIRQDIKRFGLEPAELFSGIKRAAVASGQGGSKRRGRPKAAAAGKARAKAKAKPRGKARGKAGARAGVKVPPKYRDPASGATWSGRGREPEWIKGREREPFLVQRR